ncbi:putative ABC transporter ATP-binding protein YxlF [Geobacillus sp. BCO2]|nr:putative ABC transporter ATP-binding protein YxlF [Geobacillus sp. BCO2]
MIRVSHLHKSFRVHRRDAGWLEAVRHLWRRDYRVIEAVKDVSFTIEKGEIVGFLGPNGAGKTTTMKMLAGLLHPTSGEITVGGFVPFEQKPEFKKMMSLVMGQKSQLIWDIPPLETFLVNKAIYDIDDRLFRQTLEELTELLDLAPLLDKRRAACRLANGCAASWRPRCCIGRTCCFWMSRRSGWTSIRRKTCAALSSTTIGSTRRRFC